MSDVRKLNLYTASKLDVSYGQQSEFILPDVQRTLLKTVLVELEQEAYWSPTFQAWYPMIHSYIQSGVDPEITSTWGNRLGEKVELLGPRAGTYTRCFRELLYMARTKDTEAFANVYWNEIQSFLGWIPLLLTNEKTIYSVLGSQGYIRNMLDAMLNFKQVDGLSPLLPECVYYYRHCNVGDPAEMTGMKAEIERQCKVYVEKFVAAFEAVERFCDSKKSVYAFYRDNVKDLICRAWLTSTDLSVKRYVVTKSDIIDLPVWLSEKVTEYVTDLPCVYDLPVDSLFTFNALQGVMSKTSSPDDHTSFYAYTLTRKNIKTVLDRLNTFAWDVKQGSFFTYLMFRVQQRFEKDLTGEAMSPKDYLDSLIMRGFPVKA